MRWRRASKSGCSRWAFVYVKVVPPVVVYRTALPWHGIPRTAGAPNDCTQSPDRSGTPRRSPAAITLRASRGTMSGNPGMEREILAAPATESAEAL